MSKDFAKLSERQRRMVRFMEQYVERFGYPPTIREIGDATDIRSTSVVNYNLNKLVDAGYVQRSDKVSRGLRLVLTAPEKPNDKPRKTFNFTRVPLVGHIVASAPVPIPEDIAHYFDEEALMEIPPSLLGGADPTQVFALTVKGDSMIDAMIRQGDVILLHSQATAEQGDMIAAWLTSKGETTLKYYFPEGDRVRLQPAHPTMDPIYVNTKELEIRGKVLSVIRKLN
jgi:repressor LexA